ncbi:MAG: ATP-binding protein [Pseudomonadota bacterium]
MPPFLGASLFILTGFYPFPEAYFAFFTWRFLVIASAFGLGMWLAERAHRRFLAFAQKRDADNDRAAQRYVRGFAIWMVVLVSIYSMIGAYLGDTYLEEKGYASYELIDHVRSQLGLVLVVLICTLPMLTYYFDKTGQFLAPRGVAIGAISLRTRVALLGVVAPILVDTTLLAYIYNTSGALEVSTVLLWGVLLLVSVIGSSLVWQGLNLSLTPLREFAARDGDTTHQTHTPITPISVDELGDISRRLDAVEASRHQLLRDLSRREQQLKEAERIARLGRWTYQPDGTILLSPEASAIFGFAAHEMPPTTEAILARIKPDDLETLTKLRQAAIDTGEAYSLVYRLTRADGSKRTVFESAEIDQQSTAANPSLVGVVQDITKTVETEEKLRQSQKMEAVGNLTGGVAHDFNNLLAVILGNLELMAEREETKVVREEIDAAIEASLRGADLTKNMLSFARKAPLEPEIIDINRVVTNVQKWAARVLPANIEVETTLLGGLWRTEADPNLLQNALLNLLLNARDAMPDGGKITVETGNFRILEEYIEARGEDLQPGSYVMLAVTDTGHGIAKDALEQVFAPFYTTKRPGSGSGLGLSMVEGFMKQSGGTVRIYSEVGVGTTFKLFFKAQAQPSNEVIALPSGSKQPDADGCRILVVEDEPEVLNVIAKTLRNAGYSVFQATSGDAAMQQITEGLKVDVVITDIVMPGALQGTQLAQKIRERDPEIPIVFMSGYASEATIHGNGLTPNDIRLMKPVDRVSLIKAIERARR